jgi:hypothetical protein
MTVISDQSAPTYDANGNLLAEQPQLRWPAARNRPDIEVRVLDDGTRIQFRPNSGSGGDAVDVFYPDDRTTTVHLPKPGRR